ncbi:MAG: type II secretion system protein [Minicystis sp.]
MAGVASEIEAHGRGALAARDPANPAAPCPTGYRTWTGDGLLDGRPDLDTATPFPAPAIAAGYLGFLDTTQMAVNHRNVNAGRQVVDAWGHPLRISFDATRIRRHLVRRVVLRPGRAQRQRHPPHPRRRPLQLETERPMTHHRRGFTAFELLIVIGIIMVLTGMSAAPLLPALRRGSVNDAASAVLGVADQARLLAMSRRAEPGYYGVVIDTGAQPAYVALTYGTSATVADIAMAGGKPVAKVEFNRNVMVFTGADHASATAATGPIGWLYQYRTGFPVTGPSALSSAVTAIGTADARGGLPKALSVRGIDGTHRMAVEIYSMGLGSSREP